MALTYDDQLKCVEIWKGFSGKETKPEQWHDKSAQLLAELVANVNSCSGLMTYVPQPGRPTTFWMLRQAYRIIKETLFNKGNVYEICKDYKYSQYKNLVEAALALGE